MVWKDRILCKSNNRSKQEEFNDKHKETYLMHIGITLNHMSVTKAKTPLNRKTVQTKAIVKSSTTKMINLSRSWYDLCKKKHTQ